jgi:hypothetical protein
MSLTLYRCEHRYTWDESRWHRFGADPYDTPKEMSDEEKIELQKAVDDCTRLTISHRSVIVKSPIPGYDIVVIGLEGLPKSSVSIHCEIPQDSIVIIINSLLEFTEGVRGWPVEVIEGSHIDRDVDVFVPGIEKASYVWTNMVFPQGTQERQKKARPDLVELVESFLDLLLSQLVSPYVTYRFLEMSEFRQDFGQDCSKDDHREIILRDDSYRRW